ncbi:MAG TPA: M20/M25/M40 family metallo-hydrolase [Verrucomicrobiae bacterium]|nr:M20/M25/M40 family metallo-hydrolase [Verrucomicrobiae bacterium]
MAELVALPSVNPAFVPQSGTAARQASLPKFGEKNVADFLASVAATAGLEVEFQKVFGVRGHDRALVSGDMPLHSQTERSNLIVRLLPRNKIRRTILLAPHLDTVDADDSQFVPRVKSGRLYGRGACDTKGSAAAMLTALCELAKAKARPAETEIIFAGLIDEEHAQTGSRALVRSSAFWRLGHSMISSDRLKAELQTTLAIVGEPTRLRVVTAHKGSLWLQLETRGKAAHGATPRFGQNAVHEMARIVCALETDYAARLRERKHPLLGAATVSVGVISGGTQPNIVPDRCVISIDRRTLPGESETGVRHEIAAFLRAKNLSAKISSTKLAPALPLETNPKLPLVRQFLQCVGQSKPAGVDYFCDAAVLADAGIPSVVFGPGDIAQAHTTDEWISLAELERGKNLLLTFLKSLP